MLLQSFSRKNPLILQCETIRGARRMSVAGGRKRDFPVDGIFCGELGRREGGFRLLRKDA